MVLRYTTLVLPLRSCIGPALDAGLSTGTWRGHVPPRIERKKEEDDVNWCYRNICGTQWSFVHTCWVVYKVCDRQIVWWCIVWYVWMYYINFVTHVTVDTWIMFWLCYCRQISLPTQTFHTHRLTFSPVEEHFYRQQYYICAREAMVVSIDLDASSLYFSLLILSSLFSRT